MGRPRKNPSEPQAKRCVLYARVSSKEQADGFSIDAQLRLLREYCERNRLIVADEFVDTESGSRTGRTRFGKMLAFMDAEKIAAIVVEKTDRLYRNFSDFVKVDDRASEIHFVKEGQILSPSSKSSDKLIHGVKVVLAKHFSDNLKEEIAKGMLEKARQGIFPSSAPIGYQNVSDGRRKVIAPHPEQAPIVRALFEAYAARRVSIEGATKMARDRGMNTCRSNIARMLDNPLYVGIVRWHGEDYAGIHEPLISLAVWRAAQEVMHGRTTRSGFGALPFAYRGLMTCGHCGAAVTAERKKGRYVYYRCTKMRNPDCPGGRYVSEDALTDQFAQLLDGLTLRADQFERLKQALRESLTEEAEARSAITAAIDREEQKLRRQLEQIYLDKINGDAPPEIYDSLKSRLSRELSEMEVRRKAVGAAQASYIDMGERILELAQTASLRFKRANPETKRNILLELLESCALEDRKIQVRLREPFHTMREENQKRLLGSTEEAALTVWYTEVNAIRNVLLAA